MGGGREAKTEGEKFIKIELLPESAIARARGGREKEGGTRRGVRLRRESRDGGGDKEGVHVGAKEWVVTKKSI